MAKVIHKQNRHMRCIFAFILKHLFFSVYFAIFQLDHVSMGSHDLAWIGVTCIFNPVYKHSHLFRWISHKNPFNLQCHPLLIFYFRFPQGSFLTDLVSTKRYLLTSLNLPQFPGALCMIWLILNKRPRLLDFISI